MFPPLTWLPRYQPAWLRSDVIAGITLAAYAIPVSLAYWARIAATDALRLVVCDLSNSPHVDVAGAAMLAALHRELTTRGIRLRIVEAHARARDMLRAEGLEEQLGYLGRHMTVDQAIAEFVQPAKCP